MGIGVRLSAYNPGERSKFCWRIKACSYSNFHFLIWYAKCFGKLSLKKIKQGFGAGLAVECLAPHLGWFWPTYWGSSNNVLGHVVDLMAAFSQLESPLYGFCVKISAAIMPIPEIFVHQAVLWSIWLHLLLLETVLMVFSFMRMLVSLASSSEFFLSTARIDDNGINLCPEVSIAVNPSCLSSNLTGFAWNEQLLSIGWCHHAA